MNTSFDMPTNNMTGKIFEYIIDRLLQASMYLCLGLAMSIPHLLYGQDQVTFGETNWTWWSSSLEESETYLAALSESGFDNLTFVFGNVYGGAWDFKDGEGEIYSREEVGRLDLINDDWIQNRLKQMDLALEAGLKVNVLPVWIGKRIDDIFSAGDPVEIMDAYCRRLGEAGLWTHPALKWVIFGGDYYDGRTATEYSFKDAWLSCRKHLPESIRVGYHNGELSTAIKTIHNTGVADFMFLQTGHNNEWPEYKMRELIELGIEFEWGESVYPGIDIVNNNGSDCASEKRLSMAFANGMQLRDHFQHYQYGHNDRHQNSDGSGGREEPWQCHSGDSAIESVLKHRDFEQSLMEAFKLPR